MGALVAAGFTNRDWSWAPLTTGKQGQDVKALVLISPEPNFKGLRMSDAIGDPAVRSEVAVMLIAGKNAAAPARNSIVFTTASSGSIPTRKEKIWSRSWPTRRCKAQAVERTEPQGESENRRIHREARQAAIPLGGAENSTRLSPPGEAAPTFNRGQLRRVAAPKASAAVSRRHGRAPLGHRHQRRLAGRCGGLRRRRGRHGTSRQRPNGARRQRRKSRALRRSATDPGWPALCDWPRRVPDSDPNSPGIGLPERSGCRRRSPCAARMADGEIPVPAPPDLPNRPAPAAVGNVPCAIQHGAGRVERTAVAHAAARRNSKPTCGSAEPGVEAVGTLIPPSSTEATRCRTPFAAGAGWGVGGPTFRAVGRRRSQVPRRGDRLANRMADVAAIATRSSKIEFFAGGLHAALRPRSAGRLPGGGPI